MEYADTFGSPESFIEQYGETLHGFNRFTDSWSYLHDPNELTSEHKEAVARAKKEDARRKKEAQQRESEGFFGPLYKSIFCE